jgi:hypothetical protein
LNERCDESCQKIADEIWPQWTPSREEHERFQRL